MARLPLALRTVEVSTRRIGVRYVLVGLNTGSARTGELLINTVNSISCLSGRLVLKYSMYRHLPPAARRPAIKVPKKRKSEAL